MKKIVVLAFLLIGFIFLSACEGEPDTRKAAQPIEVELV